MIAISSFEKHTAFYICLMRCLTADLLYSYIKCENINFYTSYRQLNSQLPLIRSFLLTHCAFPLYRLLFQIVITTASIFSYHSQDFTACRTNAIVLSSINSWLHKLLFSWLTLFGFYFVPQLISAEIKVAVKWLAHAINCFINTSETKPFTLLNHRYSVNDPGRWQVI